MKKLCVLLLVLGLCSYASAAVRLATRVSVGGSEVSQVNPGDVVSVVVSLTSEYAGGSDGLSLLATPATGGSLNKLGNWFLSPSLDVTPQGSGLLFEAGAALVGLPAPAGDYLEATFSIPSSASGNLGLTFNGTLFDDTPDNISMTIVPEPMTVALLGLGGLFLRRRK